MNANLVTGASWDLMMTRASELSKDFFWFFCFWCGAETGELAGLEAGGCSWRASGGRSARQSFFGRVGATRHPND